VAGPERLQAAAGAPGPRPRDPTTVWREGLDRAREYFQGSEEEKSILTGLCKKGSLKGAKICLCTPTHFHPGDTIHATT